MNETNASCRIPLLLMFLSAAVWLVLSSAFALIASLKFHSPNFLADCSWLTYGRVRPAGLDSMLYGFCVQGGLALGLWLLARLGRTALAQGWLVVIGAALWNLGLTVGVVGILAGNATGFENLDLPPYAALIQFVGYLMIGACGVLTFHQRRERRLFVSQWFLLAALFWFPWIYSTANLLLITFPVRGVAQAVIAWWYSDNLLVVWLGLVGLAAVFYLVPSLTGRELHSHYLALFTFWMLLLFGSWGGIPNSAPVPAWMPALSTVATVLTIVPILAAAVNVYSTAPLLLPPPIRWGEGRGEGRPSASPSLLFVGFGIVAFIAAGLMTAACAFPQVAQVTDFTWLTPARSQLQYYGFFAMVVFGVIYWLAPQLIGAEFPWPKLVRAHLGLSGLGVLLIALPLAVGGLVQGFKLQDASVAFFDVQKATLPFLRASTMGDL
ncbi:MAG: hypothetical protein DME25_19245, partial [Verrucomicrobia bacterium]